MISTPRRTAGVLAPSRCLRLTVLVAALVSLGWASVAHAADRVYWTNAGADEISYANLDGSGGGDLRITGATVSAPTGLALDLVAGKIYWANAADATIWYANLDGSGAGEVQTGSATVKRPAGIAVDPAAGKIYWASYNGNQISFANLDGSGGGNIDTGQATVNEPDGVAVDPAADRIYWANVGDNAISYANLDGPGAGDLSTTFANVVVPTGVALDPGRERLYWANAGGNPISFANLNSFGGGNLMTGAADADSPSGVAIDPTAGKIYWTNQLGNTISYANVDGTGGGRLATGTATVQSPAFVVLLEHPVGSGAPTITGDASSGTVSCSTGAWAADQVASFLYRAPRTLAYQWSLDGTAIPGATTRTYTPTVAGEYRCRVTASNDAGTAQQTSDPQAINRPPLPPNPAPPISPPPPTQPSRNVPSLSALRVSPSTFATAGRLVGGRCERITRSNRRRGRCTRALTLQVSFKLEATATLTFTIEHAAAGGLVAGRCLAPTRRNHSARRCIRLLAVPGTIIRHGVAGANTLTLTRRLGASRLRSGSYRLTATASVGGKVGAPVAVSFKVVP